MNFLRVLVIMVILLGAIALVLGAMVWLVESDRRAAIMITALWVAVITILAFGICEAVGWCA